MSVSSYHPKKGDPLHIGIIPDGGRRWAKKKGVSLYESYSKSFEVLLKLISYFYSEDVDEISIYVASAQNFKRSHNEINDISNILRNGMDNELLSLAHQLKFKLNIVGEIEELSNDLNKSIIKIHNETSVYKKRKLNLCIAYNPLDEIIQAFEKSTKHEDFIENLYITKPLNMIIRTGNANLLSNFLPLQSGFARLYFSDKLFNDLSMNDIERTFKEYLQLELKYGE